MNLVFIAFIAAFLADANALNNGLGLTPPMGWNTWCTQGHCGLDVCNDEEVRQIADAMATNGMKELGWEYINLDDCWADHRDEKGNIVPDPSRFPNISETIAYVNSKGFKFGVYTDGGIYTCSSGQRPHKIPGSYGHYDQDAATYASWNVQYVKMDWCNTNINGSKLDPKVIYAEMSKALNKTGKPIYFDSCEWGVENPWEWMVAFANSWRTGGDHHDDWKSTDSIIQHNIGLSKYAGPGGWNDMDFLMTGGEGCDWTKPLKHCPKMTDDEYRSEFSIWCIFASPLLVATDVRNLTAIMKETLLNEDLIAVSQDKLGKAGDKVADFDCGGPKSDTCQLLARPLSDGVAIALFNRDDHNSHNITFKFDLLPDMKGKSAMVKDLWTHKDMGEMTSVTAYVPVHGTAVYKLTPASAGHPHKRRHMRAE